MTGDARYCQADQTVTKAGGDYLLIVKENQATLLRARATLESVPRRYRPYRRQPARVGDAGSDDGRQRRWPNRRLVASTELNDYLDWPPTRSGLHDRGRLVFGGKTKRAVRYGITSLPPTVADAAPLGVLVRGHWQIENGLHYVKDVTLGEDRSLIHQGNGPSIMAILRDTVVSLLHRARWRTIAERLRFSSGNPQAALALLGLPVRENA